MEAGGLNPASDLLSGEELGKKYATLQFTLT